MTNLIQSNSLKIPLAAGSAQAIVTSPPYWGLRSYAIGDNKAAELGAEPLHDCAGWATGNDCGECYVCHMRQVAAECWRVLRDDGVMLLNLGDSYASSSKGSGGPTKKQTSNTGSFYNAIDFDLDRIGLKPKDLCAIPWRVALALQADGWWLRSDIIWSKPNPMPESVTDRPTKAHEYIFLLSKRERYYWDAEAAKDRAAGGRERFSPGKPKHSQNTDRNDGNRYDSEIVATRNLRTVWTIATKPYSGSHFATFPIDIPLRCIRAATSERGCCPTCGAPLRRVVESKTDFMGGSGAAGTSADEIGGKWGERRHGKNILLGPVVTTKTTGWATSCTCPPADPIPCTVLDPFNGAATTGLAAAQLGRRYVGLDLSSAYLRMSRERLGLAALHNWTEGESEAQETASLDDLPLFGG